MQRRVFLFAFLQAPRPLSERDLLTTWFGDLAAHLTQDSPAEFLGKFERGMDGRSVLEANIAALLKVYAVGSFANVREISGDGDERTVNVDWTLSLRLKGEGATGARRRKLLEFQLRRRKKGWVVVKLSDGAFFAP